MAWSQDPFKSYDFTTSRVSDEFRQSVAGIERDNKDKVVLYRAMSLYTYIMTWFMHGIMTQQRLSWPFSGPGGESRELPLALGVFGPGEDFPKFPLVDASVCTYTRLAVKVRDKDPENAARLGVGTVGYVDDATGYRYNVSYKTEWKGYYGCQDLLDEELVEMNEHVAPLMSEEALKKGHVSTAADFLRYLDDEVGEWRDSSWGSNGKLPVTVGLQARLFQVSMNLLSKASADPKADEGSSPWETFLEQGFFTSYDLVHPLESSVRNYGSSWNRPDKLLLESIIPAAARANVEALLALLTCVAEHAFQLRDRKLIDFCWHLGEGQLQLGPDASPSVDYDEIASVQTKEAIRKLKDAEAPAKPDFGATRVLLQLILPETDANELAYVSTDRRDSSGPPPGHVPQRWRGQSFTDAYNALKNTEDGDKVTARVLLRLKPFALGDGIRFVAHAPSFRDNDAWLLMQHILNDALAYTFSWPIEVHAQRRESWSLRAKCVIASLLLLPCLLCCVFLIHRRNRIQAHAFT
ncbi:unnamed protein product [Symbiodinium sp. CCMP2592]|nr:unnamed protein product [Symbiodinium sp. CCMP2592]